MADNNTLLDKVLSLQGKFQSLQEQLASPEAMADMKKYVQLNKDYKELEPIIAAGKEYKKMVDDLASAKDILVNEKDEELREMARMEIAEIEPKVIDFADLGVYIDQPMKSYSSGMKARLGFAFAVAIDPDILVVDEALSVGDRSFQRKCIERIREIMMDENVTVLFVTHSPGTAKQFCSRGIVLDQGKKVFDGTIDDAITYYDENY